MAIAAAALKVGSMLAKTGGAIAKGGKMAMKKGGTVLKKSKKVAGNVKKAVIKKRKINKETFMSKDRAQKKKLERDKRKQEEELLEKRNNKEKKPSPQKTMKKGGGILQKIIDFISTILIGWVVVNLPKIIDTVKGVIKKIKEKITGLKDVFTNLIANIGKGLGILKSKKNQDPEKLAKSGFGGDASAENNNSSKKADDKNSDVNVLKKDTNKLMSDTTGLKDNLNESLKKAESEMSKVDLNVVTKEINLDKATEQIKSATKDGKIQIQSPDGKTFKPTNKGELKKTQSAGRKSMKNITKDSSKFISNIKKADITKSITKNKKSKNIVVDNIIPAQNQVAQSQGESQTRIIVLGKSLNSMVKENILLDAAYT